MFYTRHYSSRRRRYWRLSYGVVNTEISIDSRAGDFAD